MRPAANPGARGLTERAALASRDGVMNLSKITLVPALVLSLGMGALGEDESPLGEAMDELSGSLKKLRRARSFEEKAELVRGGIDACIESMKHLPVQISGMPDGSDKAKAVADYKRLMGVTLVAMAELEIAFLSEDEAKAEELADKLKDIKAEGHERYNDE